MRIKVLTINMWGFPEPLSIDKKKRFIELTNLIERDKIDIVALQEIWTYKDVEFLKSRLIKSFFSNVPPKNLFFNRSGLMLFSKYKLQNCNFIKFNGISEPPSKKGIQEVSLVLGGMKVRILNTHLKYTPLHIISKSWEIQHNSDLKTLAKSPLLPIKSKGWMRQYKSLMDSLLRDPYCPTILLGDFNVYDIRDFLKDLPTNFQIISPIEESTHSVNNIYTRTRSNTIIDTGQIADLIVTNIKDIKVLETKVIKTPLISDHYPVLVTFEMQ